MSIVRSHAADQALQHRQMLGSTWHVSLEATRAVAAKTWILQLGNVTSLNMHKAWLHSPVMHTVCAWRAQVLGSHQQLLRLVSGQPAQRLHVQCPALARAQAGVAPQQGCAGCGFHSTGTPAQLRGRRTHMVDQERACRHAGSLAQCATLCLFSGCTSHEAGCLCMHMLGMRPPGQATTQQDAEASYFGQTHARPATALPDRHVHRDGSRSGACSPCHSTNHAAGIDLRVR